MTVLKVFLPSFDAGSQGGKLLVTCDADYCKKASDKKPAPGRERGGKDILLHEFTILTGYAILIECKLRVSATTRAITGAISIIAI